MEKLQKTKINLSKVRRLHWGKGPLLLRVYPFKTTLLRVTPLKLHFKWESCTVGSSSDLISQKNQLKRRKKNHLKNRKTGFYRCIWKEKFTFSLFWKDLSTKVPTSIISSQIQMAKHERDQCCGSGSCFSLLMQIRILLFYLKRIRILTTFFSPYLDPPILQIDRLRLHLFTLMRIRNMILILMRFRLRYTALKGKYIHKYAYIMGLLCQKLILKNATQLKYSGNISLALWI